MALSEVVHLHLTSVLPKKLLKRLKIYSKISFGTVHLQKLNEVLYVILSIRWYKYENCKSLMLLDKTAMWQLFSWVETDSSSCD